MNVENIYLIDEASNTDAERKSVSDEQVVLNKKNAQEIADLMNEMLALDKAAVNNLIGKRFKCNDGLADHPHIQVTSKDKLGPCQVGILGVVCGLSLRLTGHKVAITVDEDGSPVKFIVLDNV